MKATWTTSMVWQGEGHGVLAFTGAPPVSVEWAAGQTPRGDVFLAVRSNPKQPRADALHVLCQFSEATRLEGTDTVGRAVTITIRYRVNPVHAEDLDDGWITYRGHSIRIGDASPVVHAFRFAISNLVTDNPPSASWEGDGVAITISPVENYQHVAATMYVRDRFAHTANLTVSTADQEQAMHLAEITCAMLSLFLGCRVSWLHAESLDHSDAVRYAWIPNAITGAFVRMPAVPEPGLWQAVTDSCAKFSMAYRDLGLHARKLIALYTNARDDQDFLEVRGAKLGTLVDALCKAVTACSTSTQPAPTESSALSSRGAPDNANRANRQPFSRALEQVHRQLDLDLDAEACHRFVCSRNQLVHEAQFVVDSKEKIESWPYETRSQEYFAMLCFADRLMLRAFGYRGAYLDMTTQTPKLASEDPQLRKTSSP